MSAGQKRKDGRHTAARKPSAVILKSKTRFKEVLSGNLSREEEEENMAFLLLLLLLPDVLLFPFLRVLFSFFYHLAVLLGVVVVVPLAPIPHLLDSAERAAVPYLIPTSSDWRQCRTARRRRHRCKSPPRHPPIVPPLFFSVGGQINTAAHNQQPLQFRLKSIARHTLLALETAAGRAHQLCTKKTHKWFDKSLYRLILSLSFRRGFFFLPAQQTRSGLPITLRMELGVPPSSCIRTIFSRNFEGEITESNARY